MKKKTIAQPAAFREVLNYLRSLEEQGVTTEQILLTFNKDDLSIIIDILRGKSYEEIIASHKFSEIEMEKKIDRILKKMNKILV